MSRPFLAFCVRSGIRVRLAFGMLAFGVCLVGFWGGHGRWMSLTDIENHQGRNGCDKHGQTGGTLSVASPLTLDGILRGIRGGNEKGRLSALESFMEEGIACYPTNLPNKKPMITHAAAKQAERPTSRVS